MSWKEYFDVREVFTYFFKKRAKNESFNLKAMHFVNRISILIFLVCLVVMFVRACNR